jgi:hypothetical protein
MSTQKSLSLPNRLELTHAPLPQPGRRPPRTVLLAVYLYEDLIDVEGITVASVLSLESKGRDSTEFDTPELDSFAADGNTPFSAKIFDISMAEIQSVSITT